MPACWIYCDETVCCTTEDTVWPARFVVSNVGLGYVWMDREPLQSNQDLLDYLIDLSSNLERHGSTHLAEIVFRASRFATGSVSEFLHEAQLALEHVKAEGPDHLAPEDLEDIDSALSEISAAFDRTGGA